MYCLGTQKEQQRLPAPPAHAMGLSQMCLLTARHKGCGDGEGGKERDAYLYIFSWFRNPCILDPFNFLAPGRSTRRCKKEPSTMPGMLLFPTECIPELKEPSVLTQSTSALSQSISLPLFPSNQATISIKGTLLFFFPIILAHDHIHFYNVLPPRPTPVYTNHHKSSQFQGVDISSFNSP